MQSIHLIKKLYLRIWAKYLKTHFAKNGQSAHEKMLDVSSHQRNANSSHMEKQDIIKCWWRQRADLCVARWKVKFTAALEKRLAVSCEHRYTVHPSNPTAGYSCKRNEDVFPGRLVLEPVLVPYSCFNKLLWTGWLQQRKFVLTALEAGRPKSGCWQGSHWRPQGAVCSVQTTIK